MLTSSDIKLCNFSVNSGLACNTILICIYLPFCCEISATGLSRRTVYCRTLTVTLQRDAASCSGLVPLSTWLACTGQRLNLSWLRTMNYSLFLVLRTLYILKQLTSITKQEQTETLSKTDQWNFWIKFCILWKKPKTFFLYTSQKVNLNLI